MNFLYILLFSALFGSSIASDLEQVTDDELLNLFRSENYVVVLFTKRNCAECDNYEKALVSVREDIVESIGAWVVKAVESHLVKLYSNTKEPALVFFRHGVPLLYDGEINEDLILHTFNDNKEPIVKELTDDNFESLTQAATGATTGDWFVMFYSSDCVECQRMQARWEAVGSKIKTRMNIARVNKHTTGSATARRFRVSEVPYFLFFRLGKLYHYNIPKYNVASFVTFASEWFRNAKSEKVPLPKAPFDDFTLLIADYLRDNPWIWKLMSLSVCCGIIIAVVSKIKQRKELQRKREKLEKKEKDKLERKNLKRANNWNNNFIFLYYV